MEELRKAMKKVQDAFRYEHTLGVAYTAACLASLYEVDVKKAMRAGLLHSPRQFIVWILRHIACRHWTVPVRW